MGNGRVDRRLAQVGLTLFLTAAGLQAQSVPNRLRGVPGQSTGTPGNPVMMPGAPPATTAGVPAGQRQVQPTTPASPGQAVVQPQAASAPVSQPTSLLQQPAQQAHVSLSGQRLSIRADNSSLSSILHDIANISGMKIEGLGSDERVFGTFGPGAPRDVIADLLNGTAYNVVLLGDLSNGAPRELILTPSSHSGGAAVPAQAPQMNAEESEPDAGEPPQPQPEPQPDQPNTTQPPGSVRSPQQLFEQLQRMRQNQAQQPQDQQQQTPPQQQ